MTWVVFITSLAVFIWGFCWTLVVMPDTWTWKARLAFWVGGVAGVVAFVSGLNLAA